MREEGKEEMVLDTMRVIILAETKVVLAGAEETEKE